MFLTYHQKYSPPKKNQQLWNVHKYSVKKKGVGFWNPESDTPDLIDIGLPQRGSYSMNKRLKKMRRAIKTVWEDDIRMDGMQAIFSKNYTSHTI